MSKASEPRFLDIDAPKVLRALLLCVVVLHILNLPAIHFRALEDPSFLQRAYAVFLSVGDEGKIPTWYSACVMIACAVLLAIIAADARGRGDRHVPYWAGLSFIFVYLSMDEALSIHEMANGPVRDMVELSGPLRFGWVIPASLCLLVFGLLYLRFLFRLPGRTRTLFVLSGLIFVGGALGLEMISAAHWDLHGKDATYLVVTTFEEVMEMTGMALFLFALLDHISRQTAIAIRF